MGLPPEPAQALAFAVRFCAIAELIGLAELAGVRRELGPGGFLDWSLIGILAPVTRTRPGSAARRIFSRTGTRFLWALVVADAATAAAVLLRPDRAVLILTLAATHLALLKRHHFTIDGSDQMALVVLVACGLGRVSGDPASLRAAVTFLAAELTLSYIVAGLYKAASPYWQSGVAFAMLVQTRMYGQPAVARAIDRRPTLGHLAALSVVVWESSFVMAITAPPAVAVAVLAAGLAFHVGCGAIMGLNRFLWAFAAGYPAVLSTNAALRAALGGRPADVVTVAAGSGVALAILVLRRRPPVRPAPVR